MQILVWESGRRDRSSAFLTSCWGCQYWGSTNQTLSSKALSWISKIDGLDAYRVQCNLSVTWTAKPYQWGKKSERKRDLAWPFSGPQIFFYCTPTPALPFFLVKGGLCLEQRVSYHIFSRVFLFQNSNKKAGILEMVKGFSFDLMQYHSTEPPYAPSLHKINARPFILALSLSLRCLWNSAGYIKHFLWT